MPMKKLFAQRKFYKNNHIEITLTNACNVMCSYCPQSNYIKSYKNLGKPSWLPVSSARLMTVENFQRVLVGIDHAVERIFFTGFTEPLANPNWYECVSLAIEKGYQVFLNTTLIGARAIDIDNLLSLKIPLRIHLTDSKKVVADGIYERIAKEYRGDVKFDYFTETGRLLFPQANGNAGEINSRSDNVSFAPSIKLRGPVFCKEFRQYSNVVLPDGNVAVCCSDFSLSHIIGNIYQNSLREIHESDKLNIFINQMLSDESSFCNNCEYAAEIPTDTKGQLLGLAKLAYRRIKQ